VRGFITRLKIRKYQEMMDNYERAKLNEMLSSMQASVKDYSKAHLNQTPSLQMSAIKENVTAEKNYTGMKSMIREEVPEMPNFKEEPKV
jgi:hypothetical protein